MTLPLLPIGLAALFAALAQPFGGRRRLLLALSAGALTVGALAAVAVELLGRSSWRSPPGGGARAPSTRPRRC